MLIVRHARLGIDRGLRNQREALTVHGQLEFLPGTDP